MAEYTPMGSNNTGAPTGGYVPMQAPAPVDAPKPAAPDAGGGIWGAIQGFFAGKAAQAPAPAAPPAKAPESSTYAPMTAAAAPAKTYTPLEAPAKSQTSPYFYTKTPSGATLGASDQLDTMGKPLLAYRNPGDTATTTDKTRVATTFDPRVPQVLTPDTFKNARDPNVTKLRTVMGTAYNQELDHKIALELSGSNKNENLQSETAIDSSAPYKASSNPTPTDALENTLAKEVATGKKSLFQAQTELAHAKGIPTPWTPDQSGNKQPLNSFFDTIKNYVGHFFGAEKASAAETPKPSLTAEQIQAIKDAGGSTITQAPEKTVGQKVSAWLNQVMPGYKPEEDPYSNLGLKVKLPFLNRTITLPKTDNHKEPNGPAETLTTTLGSMADPNNLAKGLIEWPERLWNDAGAIKSAFSMKDTTAPQSTSLKPDVGNFLSDMGTFHDQLIDKGWSPAGANALSMLFGASAGVTEIIPAFGFFKSMIGKMAVGASAVSPAEHVAAWESLGMPKTVDEGVTTAKGLLVDLSNQTNGFNTPAASKMAAQIQDLMNVIKEKGIPAQTPRYIQAAHDLNSLLETNVKDLNDFKFPSSKGNTTPFIKPAGALPGYIDTNPNQVPIGLSTKSVTPVGFGEEPGAEAFKPSEELTTKTLQKLEGKTEVSKQYISDLAKNQDLKAPERDLLNRVLAEYPDGQPVPVKEFGEKVQSELLPLKEFRMTSEREGVQYENIALPDKERGNVANYSERIYESPIKTAGGAVHFNEEAVPGYFAHSRIEDLQEPGIYVTEKGVPQSTRRVIELQSDLFQKGRLEDERNLSGLEVTHDGKKYTLDSESGLADHTLYLNSMPDADGNRKSIALPRSEVVEENPGIVKTQLDRHANIDKLEPYRNTWHERVIREEVKQAAKDGKTKLQFPTGETAMKIEGLGENSNWLWRNPKDGYLGDLSVDNLKNGREIEEAGGAKWIITDVLGDGKFKAISKRDFDMVESMKKKDPSFDIKKYTESRAETFDISGKVDTENPIYKFYENTVAKYLKRYGGKTITDAQGVTWNEINVPKEAAKSAVTAFKRKPLFSKLEGPRVSIEKARELIFKDIPQKDVRLIFRDELIEGYALGMYTSPRATIKAVLRPLIELYEEGGMTSAHTAYHEAAHYLFDNLMDAEEKSAAIATAKKEISWFDKMGYRINGYSKDQVFEEYLADKYADQKTKGAGFKGPFKSIFERIDAILKRIVDWAKKVKAHLDALPNRQGGFVKNPFGQNEIEKILSEKSGEAPGLFSNPAIGKIDAIYGRPTVGSKKGFGLAKIETDHPEILPHLSEALATAKVVEKLPQRTILETSGAKPIRLIVDHQLGTEPKTFLNNAYYVVPRGGIEPPTSGFSDLRSTIELPRHEGSIGGGSAAVNGDRIVDNSVGKKDEEIGHIGEFINKENVEAMQDIEDRAQRLAFRKDALDSNPAKALVKYANKKTGELPEVLGGSSSVFGQRGDQIVTELGFKDSEEARAAYEKYAEQRRAFQKDMESFMADKRTVLQRFKEDRLMNGPGRPAGTYDEDIAEKNGGVVPPEVRGGIQAPEIDWTKAKDVRGGVLDTITGDRFDIGTMRLGRDTMERNLEKILPPEEAAKANKFLVERIRQNELDKVKFNNNIRRVDKAKMKSLGIKTGSNEDQLIQLFGEGHVNLDQLKKATPKWKEVQSAVDHYRKQYDELIDRWNAVRKEFQYQPVPKRGDYFRHFDEINEFAKLYGFLTRNSQLPTEMAGLTHNFKPGKPFTTAELSRTGNRTKYSAIKGMDNYLNTVSRQIFHIDSVQRGRALTKYLRQVAKATDGKPDSAWVRMPNFVQNLEEFTNLVAGKSAMFDRALESTVGRPILRFLSKITHAFGANVIAGNISAAITHAIPVSFNLATVGKIGAAKGLTETLISPLRPWEDFTKVAGEESSFLTRRYPVPRILNTKLDNVKASAGFIFKTVDQFISKLAVSSKYFELTGKGIDSTEAMKQADNYAQRVIGDRSIGNLPNLMNTKSLGWLTQFQIEVNDNMQVLMHDIPRWNQGNKWRIGSALVQFAIYSYLFNLLWKQIKGTGKGLDPINLGLTITGLNDESAGMNLTERVKTAGGDLLGELPFSSIFTGNYPVAQGLAISDLFSGKKTLGQWFENLAVNFGSPIGGGVQAKKTLTGLQEYLQGFGTNAKGQKTYTIDQNVPNAIKAVLFGPISFEGKQQNNVNNAVYNQIKNAGSAANKAFLPTYQQIKSLSQSSSSADRAKGQSIYDNLTEAELKSFKSIYAAEKRAATVQREKDIIPTVDKAAALYKAGKTAEAAAIYDGLSPAEQKAFSNVYSLKYGR